MKENKNRCAWACKTEIEARYHDLEWGVPLYDNLRLFEFLNLEGAQAGISWLVVLQKRQNYRNSFDNFNPEKMAHYDDNKIGKLLLNKGIIRNKLKINAMVNNARIYLNMQQNGINFSDYLWQFVDGKPIINSWKKKEDIPARTEISDLMSKSLKKKGFKFVGSTICYAFMQATGMVNDHTVDCWRYKELL